MRRFLRTRTGKAICHLVVFGMVLPFAAYLTVSRAMAQVQAKPQWAVIPFVNEHPGNGGTDYGNVAAQSVYDELAKSNNYDIVPMDSVNRSIQELNLTTPVTDQTSLLRLAGDLNVATIVTGRLVAWNVANVGGGKQATVGIVVKVVDVASGLPINGAVVNASSSVRSSATTQDQLIQEALTQASAQAVAKIQSQILPRATVLNTRNNEGLINRGARDGFQDGQTVIVTRGREQVATASVFGTEPDGANIKIIHQIKGIQPGDKVQVVFETGNAYPTPAPNSQGNGGTVMHPVNPPGHVNASGIISAGLVLGVVGFLLSGGRSNNNTAVDNVTAQAGNFPTNSGNPVIQISWRLDPFYRNSNNVQFLIFRNDNGNIPVQVSAGDTANVFDDQTVKNISTFFPLPDINSLACTQTPTTNNYTNIPGIQLGVPYLYKVAGVYRVLAIDIPGVTTGTGGANAGTTGLAGGTTGGLAGGTTGGLAGGTTGLAGGTTGLAGGTTGLAGGTTGLVIVGSHHRPQATTGLNGGTGGTTATTGGTNTTGNTTGNNTTTTGSGTSNAGTTGQITTGGGYCFFVSNQTTAKGFATALGRATLVSPTQDQALTGYAPFTFSSLVTQQAPVTLAYVIQISDNPLFPGNATVTTAEKISADQGDQSISIPQRFSGDTFQRFLSDHFGSATTFYWRVGGRNIEDVPGPLPDATTGLRYVFSNAGTFTITNSAPPPGRRSVNRMSLVSKHKVHAVKLSTPPKRGSVTSNTSKH